ncbi:hypothetical protein [Amycolatopsis sp. CA-128772]|uniref:hypothetical protein n=1 Tax=Amycolatopsis sp. CA-128772 TaxID=2073159 RepID=UPI0011B085A9|nr:hypothetical protein [Amycolatopsis sp. CA-128772]
MTTRMVTSNRTMTADADIVLNTASDATRAKAWLPEGGAGGYDVDLRAGEGRVEWRTGGWTGDLTVTGSGTGASEAELRAKVDDDADPGDVRERLDRALSALAAEVDQNFNVS